MRDKKSKTKLSIYKMVKARKLWHTEELHAHQLYL